MSCAMFTRLRRMYTKWSQILWNHISCCTRLRLPFWPISNYNCLCNCIQFDNEQRSFCFPFFSPVNFLDPILPLQCVFEFSFCCGILYCIRVPLLIKTLLPVILIDPWGTLEVIGVTFVLSAYIPRFTSVFLASVHHHSHIFPNCNNAIITVRNHQVRPRGAILELISARCLCLRFMNPNAFQWNPFWPGAIARFSPIHLLHSGHRAGCFVLFPWKIYFFPFVKTKINLFSSHLVVVSCSEPLAVSSDCCCDETFSVNNSSIRIWI